jgi:hypothetical protein
MIEGFTARHIGGAVFAFTAALLMAGLGPLYLSDTYFDTETGVLQCGRAGGRAGVSHRASRAGQSPR